MVQPTASVAERVARLRRTLLFTGLEPAALRAIAEQVRIEERGPGERVVVEGDEGNSLYVVTRGLLRASRGEGHRSRVLGEIHKGGFFGEFALLEVTPRTATVEAVSHTQLLRLTRQDLEGILDRHPEIRHRMRETLELRRAAGDPPFAPPAEDLRKRLAEVLHVQEEGVPASLEEELEWLWLPAPALLMEEGDPADAAYFVLEGRLQAFKRAADGAPMALLDAGPGDSVGEMALLSRGRRTASVKALLNTALLRLSREGFDHLVASAPSVSDAFRACLVERVTQRYRSEASRKALRLRGDHLREPVTMEDCEEVLRTTDLVLRNLRITRSYHRLALEVADVLGPEDVNWLAFGAHASRSAGYSIRKEEVPGTGVFERLTRTQGVGTVTCEAGERLRRSPFGRLAEGVLENVSAALSDGNLRIFSDMAPVIVRFLDLVRSDGSYDAEKMQAFRASLVAGPPEAGGQDLLGAALDAWYRAAHEPDPVLRSQLVLLGNARLGLHEQTLVQPDIEEALGAPLRSRVGDEYGRIVERLATPLPGRTRRLLQGGADAVQRRYLDAATRILRRVITGRMMRLRMPEGDVWLGGPVPGLPDGSPCPPELRELRDPELVELFARFVSDLDAGGGNGAVDWADLQDRMSYILRLFRAQHRNGSLFSPPLDPPETLRVATAARGTSPASGDRAALPAERPEAPRRTPS